MSSHAASTASTRDAAAPAAAGTEGGVGAEGAEGDAGPAEDAPELLFFTDVAGDRPDQVKRAWLPTFVIVMCFW